MEENLNSQAQPLTEDSLKLGEVQEKKLNKFQNLFTGKTSKRGELPSPSCNLGTLEEESEDDSQSITSSHSRRSLMVQRAGDGIKAEKQVRTWFTILDVGCMAW